ncbi:MAG: beta-galactosidase, partial [Bacilli bacterium]
MFTYGVQYYRPPGPNKGEWERDLDRLTSLGFNSIKIWVMWNWCEPMDGVFDLEDIDFMLSLCDRKGIKVVPNVILENAPHWVVKKFPEGQYVNNTMRKFTPQARANTPTGGWPGLCLHHSEVRTLAERFVINVVNSLKTHSCILAWDCWNEPHWEPRSEPYMNHEDNLWCYCESTVSEYRRWLRQTYGNNIELLNQDWMQRYSDWNQIQPPTRYGGYPDMINWRRFAIESLSETMEWRAATIRRHDSSRPVMSHSSVPGYDAGFGEWGCNDHELVNSLDLYGRSAFPLWENDPLWLEGFRWSIIRSAADSRPIWLSELQGGAASSPLGLFRSSSPNPNHFRSWIWLAIASGATGVMYWQYRNEKLGPEAPGFGLTEVNGEITDRTLYAGEIGKVIQRYEELFLNREVTPSKFAIVVDMSNYLLCRAAQMNENESIASSRGIFKGLWDLGRVAELVTY